MGGEGGICSGDGAMAGELAVDALEVTIEADEGIGLGGQDPPTSGTTPVLALVLAGDVVPYPTVELPDDGCYLVTVQGGVERACGHP